MSRPRTDPRLGHWCVDADGDVVYPVAIDLGGLLGVPFEEGGPTWLMSHATICDPQPPTPPHAREVVAAFEALRRERGHGGDGRCAV